MRGRLSFPRGFTLLEILVALAVLSIALAALLGSITASVDNSAYLRDKTFAHWVAMNSLAELRLSPERPALGTQEGSEELGGHEWTWRRLVEPTPDPDLHQLQVAVYAHKNDTEALYVLYGFSGR